MSKPPKEQDELEQILDAHAEVYAKTTMQYLTGEITEEERNKEWHHSDLKTRHAFQRHRQRHIEAECLKARIEFLQEETDDIEEAIILWRKNERKHHSWLLAWFEDNKSKLAELTQKEEG